MISTAAAGIATPAPTSAATASRTNIAHWDDGAFLSETYAEYASRRTIAHMAYNVMPNGMHASNALKTFTAERNAAILFVVSAETV